MFMLKVLASPHDIVDLYANKAEHEPHQSNHSPALVGLDLALFFEASGLEWVLISGPRVK